MPRFCRSSLAVVLAAAACVSLACGGDPPDKEMQQAQGAIDAARAAGADQYSHEEFAAAEEALKHAQEAVNDRDYRLALNYALDSRERAQNAAKEAADNKATARGDADRAIADVTAALTEARTKLKAAPATRAAAKPSSQAQKAIADTEAALQKARAAFDQHDYRAVTATLPPVTARLRGATHDLEGAAAPAARRRR